MRRHILFINNWNNCKLKCFLKAFQIFGCRKRKKLAPKFTLGFFSVVFLRLLLFYVCVIWNDTSCCCTAAHTSLYIQSTFSLRLVCNTRHGISESQDQAFNLTFSKSELRFGSSFECQCGNLFFINCLRSPSWFPKWSFTVEFWGCGPLFVKVF